MKPYLDFVDIKPGDTVASIGARSMTLETSLSMFTDSVTFYCEDIDSSCVNQETLRAVMAYYTKIRGTPLTNRFFIVTGDAHSTHLKKSSVNKILIANSLHEFTEAASMMGDVYRVLKPNGLLFIEEAPPWREKQLHSGCNRPMFDEKMVRNVAGQAGFLYQKKIVLSTQEGKPDRMLYAFTKPDD